MTQRHRGARRQRRAQAQRHGVDAGHGAGLSSEITLDDTRQQHADNPNAGPGNQAAGEQAHFTERTA